jgi:formylglycine-generating enzyme
MRIVGPVVLAAVVVSIGWPAGLALAQPSLLLSDGFESGTPASWSLATGWNCVDGSAPLAGNSTVEEPGDSGCPDGMARVDAFCVDRFEASLARLPEDGGEPVSPFVDPGAIAVRALSVRNATPQGYVNEVTAASACLNAGKRLCTNTEWLRACRGPSSSTYPYGNALIPGLCNDARDVHPLVEYYGTTDPWIWGHTDQSCLDQLPATLDRTGRRVGCVSAEGPYDMMGNLLEWTSDPAGTLRGGSYVDSVVNGPGCTYTTTAHDVNHRDFLTGFRCCADAF